MRPPTVPLRTIPHVVFALFIVAQLVSASAHAQLFPIPGKPIRIVVPFPPGGLSDVHARQLANRLGPALGVPVIVENRPGASTIIGAQAVARAVPDGHTLLYAGALTVASNPHLFSRLPYDPFRDFSPISFVSDNAAALAVSTRLPVTSVAELVAYAKKRPGQLNFGSWSLGSAGHLSGEVLNEAAGIELVHIPYKGSSEMIQALLAGDVQVAFDNLASLRPLEQTGKVRLIAITGDKRSPAAPALPTMREAGAPGTYAPGSYYLLGPAKMSPATVMRLNAELVKILKLPEVQEMYSSAGMEVIASSSEDAVSAMRRQSDQLGRIIRKLGLKLD